MSASASLSTAPASLPPNHHTGSPLAGALHRLWAINRPLMVAGVVMLATLAATLVGLVVDERVITGAPAWLKPAKFAVSIAIYCVTLVWLLGFVEGHRRLVSTIAWGTAIALVVEEFIIAGQALRGTTSHFNEATTFDATLWKAMGASIVVAWLLNLTTAVLLIRQRLPNPVFAWGLRLGVLVSFVGMGTAFWMAGIDAHSVGVADGGAGLPIVGWSTVGGDLRGAHFVGLHALQLMPLVGWLLARPAMDRLGVGRRVGLVWTAALLYLGLVLLLFWQALRGEPIAAPGGVTLTTLALLVAAALLATGVLVASGRRAGPEASARA